MKSKNCVECKHFELDEIAAICHLISNPDVKDTHNPPESAYESVKLIEKLKESAARGGETIRL